MATIYGIEITKFNISPIVDENIRKHFNIASYQILGTYCDRENDFFDMCIPKQRAWVKIAYAEGYGKCRVERFPISGYNVHDNGEVDIY